MRMPLVVVFTSRQLRLDTDIRAEVAVRTLAEQAGESDSDTPPPPPSYLVSFEPSSEGLCARKYRSLGYLASGRKHLT